MNYFVSGLSLICAEHSSCQFRFINFVLPLVLMDDYSAESCHDYIVVVNNNKKKQKEKKDQDWIRIVLGK